MKQLVKRTNANYETLEAYAACSACPCYACTCNASGSNKATMKQVTYTGNSMKMTAIGIG